jgi:hypothetical protein
MSDYEDIWEKTPDRLVKNPYVLAVKLTSYTSGGHSNGVTNKTLFLFLIKICDESRGFTTKFYKVKLHTLKIVIFLGVNLKNINKICWQNIFNA